MGQSKEKASKAEGLRPFLPSSCTDKLEKVGLTRQRLLTVREGWTVCMLRVCPFDPDP